MTTQPDTTDSLDQLAADLARDLADPDNALGLTADQAATAATFGVHWLDGAGCLAPNADPWFTRHADGHVEAHWPDGVQRALVARELVDACVKGMHLWQLMGMQPDDQVCGHRERFGGEDRVCLLPASHVDEGRQHRGLGATWSL